MLRREMAREKHSSGEHGSADEWTEARREFGVGKLFLRNGKPGALELLAA